MTLQKDRADVAPGTRTYIQTGGLVDELPEDGQCAEDCHFCWGPETD